MDCIILVTQIDNGIYLDWRNVRDGVRCLLVPKITDEDDLRTKCEAFACHEKDVDAVMNIVAMQHPDVEIRAFKMIKIASAKAMPAVIRNVTKDGVLPF